MINRTFKFYTQAFSELGTVSVVAKFNGQQVYSGTIPTVNDFAPSASTKFNTLGFEWTGPIDIQGQVPFELTVAGGTVFFGSIEANYSGVNFKVDTTDPSNPIIIVNTAPENFWQDVNQNTVETDGKTNVMINGVKQFREILNPSLLGDWYYKIFDTQTLTCDIFVDPELIVTRAPTIEELAARLGLLPLKN
jgi:hypothetical protein